MRPLRFALVGSSGFAASMVAPALLSAPTEFVGVLGSTPERSAEFARRLGVRGYTSLEELAGDPGVDAVWVAARDVLHEPIGVACLEAGKHVLMEKPMASSAAGGRALEAAAQRSGVVLRVGCHQRFRPVYRDLRELIASGRLGEIGFVRLQFLWEFPEDRLGDSWRASRQGSGGSWVAKEFGAHLLDLLLWWTDTDAEVTGAVLATQRFSIETEDCAAILLRLSAGGIGIIEVSSAMSGRTHTVEIQGTRGWAKASEVWRGNGWVQHSTGERTEYHNDQVLQPYLAQLDDFACAVAGGPSTGADGPAGMAVMELVEAAIAVGRDRILAGASSSNEREA
jgi:predicted dehydrogenase